MKFPRWALPAVIILFVVVRIFIAIRFQKTERERTGKGWFERLKTRVLVFWIVLGIAVLSLLFWRPKKVDPVGPIQSTDPASEPGTPPAARDSRSH